MQIGGAWNLQTPVSGGTLRFITLLKVRREVGVPPIY